jgi:cyclophilin family peptidyl-prolyl cis-trans isomerase
MRVRAVLLVAALLAAGLIAACGGGDDADESTEQRPPSGCDQVEAPAPKQVDLKRPVRLEAPPAGTVARVDTSCGSLEIALDTSDSPRTTASFAYLAEHGVYDGTAFHRIVPDFVIQGGDPAGDGTGGPGYFVDEPPPPDVEYTRGTVAMAKNQVEPPGRSGSQFFVVVAADAGLPPDFALLGEVTTGFEVAERIAESGDPESGQTGTPRAPVVIDRVTLERG